jgi:hypothetical protein
VLGWRRTHKGPDDGRMGADLLLAPGQSRTPAVATFSPELQRRSPGRYQPLHIRTLQRGMRKIRAYLLETREEQWPRRSDRRTIVPASLRGREAHRQFLTAS